MCTFAEKAASESFCPFWAENYILSFAGGCTVKDTSEDVNLTQESLSAWVACANFLSWRRICCLRECETRRKHSGIIYTSLWTTDLSVEANEHAHFPKEFTRHPYCCGNGSFAIAHIDKRWFCCKDRVMRLSTGHKLYFATASRVSHLFVQFPYALQMLFQINIYNLTQIFPQCWDPFDRSSFWYSVVFWLVQRKVSVLWYRNVRFVFSEQIFFAGLLEEFQVAT